MWLLLTWVPETAAIRQKMLYASTKATLKTEFGSAYIKDEINATAKVSNVYYATKYKIDEFFLNIEYYVCIRL